MTGAWLLVLVLAAPAAAAVDERSKQKETEQEKEARYRGAGLAPIGLDVYAGRMAYYYRGKDQLGFDIDYDPLSGFRYPRPYTWSEIDYSSMTLSGSVVNASDEVRNVGVAVVFFDENGSQVGGQIVQINNARKDVPYPFTATVSMALAPVSQWARPRPSVAVVHSPTPSTVRMAASRKGEV